MSIDPLEYVLSIPHTEDKRPKRILVTGSRDWGDDKIIRAALWASLEMHGPYTLIHGDCPTGADKIADDYADMINDISARSIEVIKFPANWSRDGAAAGPIRNRAMVESGVDICYGFIRNRSRGATNCVSVALTLGVPIRTWTQP
jgi:hypothetical protein